MIDLQALPELPPYGMTREEKRAFLARELGELTRNTGGCWRRWARSRGRRTILKACPFCPCAFLRNFP